MLNKQAAQQQRLVKKFLLPDTCTVYPRSGANPTVTTDGITTFTAPVARTYLGSTSIPCRFDLSRAFRPARLADQATLVDEYIIELPYDFVFEEHDIIYSPGGERYIIRKRDTESVWSVTQEAQVTRLGADLDV